MKRPVIDKIEPQIVEGISDTKISLVGQNLSADRVKLLFDSIITAEPDPNTISSTNIETALPSQLQAGIKSVLVAHPLVIGEPPIEHGNWNNSNVAAFRTCSENHKPVWQNYKSPWRLVYVNNRARGKL